MKKLKTVKNFKQQVANITVWEFFKWVLIFLFVAYVGYCVYRDITGLRIAAQITYTSDGLINPVLAK